MTSKIKDTILATIKRGEVTMRPRWHFVLKAILTVLGLIFVALTLVFFTSLITFLVQDSGAWLAPGLGLPGFKLLMMSLPWLLVLVAVVLIVILEILVSYYSFAYRRPLLYSILGVVVVAVVGGGLLAQTPLHPGLTQGVRDGRIPFARPLYGRFDPGELPTIHPGTVTVLTDQGFTLSNHRGELLQVRLTEQTLLPPGFELVPDLEVVVFGEVEAGVIDAIGVKNFDPRLPPRDRTSLPKQ